MIACQLALAFCIVPAAAADFQLLHKFTGGASDGAYPLASLITDGSGNFYGTTALGGAGTACKVGCGVVFELSFSSAGWNESVLYSFRGLLNNFDGAVPAAGLILDQAGNLYGTTSEGGLNGCNGYGCGTVFKIAPNGTSYSILYRFQGGPDGQNPRSSLTMDKAGNLYGTTAEGGVAACGYFQTGCGTVFEIATNGTKTTLYSFKGAGASPPDGESPRAALVLDPAGNLYGTTISGGGTNNSSVCINESCGTVFELLPGNPTDTILYSFRGGATDGGNPVSSVILDENGNVDGTTLYGGNRDCFGYGCGTVFQLSSTGVETNLYPFSPNDGEAPVAGLIQDSSGNLDSVACGEACNGGRPAKHCSKGCEYGTVYQIPQVGGRRGQIKLSQSFTVIHSFNDALGSSPTAPLLFVAGNGGTGTLYGTTQNGGARNGCFAGCGTIFSVVINWK